MGKSRTLHVISTLACVLIACAGLFIITERSSKKTLNTMIEEEVDNLIKSIQNSVEAYNYSNFATIHIAATIPIIRDPNVSIKEKAEQLFGVKNADPNLVGLNITDLKGNSYLVEGPMYNFSERAYFKNALNGKETVFGPINNKVTNIPTIFYGAPLYDDDGNLINTFFLAAHGETLSKICEQNRIGVDGKAVIIRRTTGLVIADIDEDAILKNNAYDDAADSGVKELQRITTDIAAGESGFAFIKLPDGSTVVNGYAPINGTDWSIIVRANYADFTAPLKHQRMLVILFSAIVLVLSGVILFFTYGKKQKSAKSE